MKAVADPQQESTQTGLVKASVITMVALKQRAERIKQLEVCLEKKDITILNLTKELNAVKDTNPISSSKQVIKVNDSCLKGNKEIVGQPSLVCGSHIPTVDQLF